MTAVDWAKQSVAAFKRKPPHQALKHTVSEFASGLDRRLRYVYARGRGTYPMRIGGYTSRFAVECSTDIERARTANRERAVVEFVLDGLEADSVFWDIGAYHGHYSVHAAQTGADVIAFEPARVNAMRIEWNRHVNGVDVTIRGIALSTTSGTVSFDGDVPSEYGVDNDGGGSKTVTAMRGDEVDEPQPDVIKIDVEGHECAVLDGLCSTLQEAERVAVEVHDGVEPAAVASRLEAAGLSVRELQSSRSQTYLGGVR